jgi:hypothetical protein
MKQKLLNSAFVGWLLFIFGMLGVLDIILRLASNETFHLIRSILSLEIE